MRGDWDRGIHLNLKEAIEMNYRRTGLAMAAGISMFLLSACGGATTNPAAATPSGPTGTLKVGLYNTNVTLDPALSHAVVDGQVEDQIFNSLLTLDKAEYLAPGLATRWSVSPSGLTYTFYLRRGVKFSDGTPFNASAVKFNIERMLNPATASPRKSLLGPVSAVTVVNSQEVRIELSAPYAPLLNNLAGVAGEMSSPTAIKKWGSAYGQHPVGTGPFVLKNWNPGGDVTLVANPHYWQPGLPKVAKIVFIPITNSQSMVTALNTREIDLADTISPTVISQVESSAAKVEKMPGLGFFVLNLNENDPPLNNVHVRRAIEYAINRSVVNRVIYDGTATPAYSELSPTSWAYDPNLHAPFSDSLAKAELQKAGLSKGFTLTIQAQNATKYVTLTQILQSELAKVGIKVKIDLLDYATYLNNLNSGQYQADFINDSGSVDPDGNYIFNVSSADIVKNGYDDPAVNNLMNQARATTSESARKALYWKVAKHMLADVPMVFLVNPSVIVGISDTVHGFTLYPNTTQFYLDTVSVGH